MCHQTGSLIKTEHSFLHILLYIHEQSCPTVTKPCRNKSVGYFRRPNNISHFQIRCGTRAAAHRTSPTNTQSCETLCHRSRLLPSTPAPTPRRVRPQWRWRVCWLPTAACTAPGGRTSHHILEVLRSRRVRRPTRCTKRRQPLTVTATEQLHQSTQVTTFHHLQNICGGKKKCLGGTRIQKPYICCLHRRSDVLRGGKVGRFALVQMS